MRAADNERAKRDVKKRRDDEKEKREKQYHAAEEARETRRQRKQFEKFCGFMKLACKVNLPESDLDKIKPILKVIGKGDFREGRKVVTKWEKKLTNGSLETLWERLSESEKDLF